MIISLNSAKLSGRKTRVNNKEVEQQLTLNLINLMTYPIKVNKKPEIPEDKYLKVVVSDPSGYVWLMPSNNYTDDVDILSNVIWTVN